MDSPEVQGETSETSAREKAIMPREKERRNRILFVFQED